MGVVVCVWGGGGRSVDPFCLVCMVSDLRDPTGEQTRKTRVVAGNRNPKWNQQFSFPLPAAGDARDGPVVTVVVLDYDKRSADDLIGCVSVNVPADVPRAPGFLENWFPIIAGGTKPGRPTGAHLRMRLERLGGSAAAALGRTAESEPGAPPPPPRLRARSAATHSAPFRRAASPRTAGLHCANLPPPPPAGAPFFCFMDCADMARRVSGRRGRGGRDRSGRGRGGHRAVGAAA